MFLISQIDHDPYETVRTILGYCTTLEKAHEFTSSKDSTYSHNGKLYPTFLITTIANLDGV